MCDNRNSEIAALMANNREFEKRNDAQSEENRNISFNVLLYLFRSNNSKKRKGNSRLNVRGCTIFWILMFKH